MGIGNLIKGILNIPTDRRTNVAVPLSQDFQDELMALRQEVATLMAQLGRVSAQQKEQKESEKQKDKEKEGIKELREKEKEIFKEKFGSTISLKRFFAFLDKNKKFAQEVEITDKDDKEVFGIFGDLQVITDGKYAGMFVVTDIHGNPIVVGNSLSQIIYKPETIGNQFKRKRIAIPRDSKMNPVIDFENIEISDLVFNPNTNEYEETQEYRAKAKEVIMKYILELQDKEDYIARLEKTQSDQQTEITDLRRTLTILRNENAVHQSEMSKVMGEHMQFSALISDMNKKLLLGQELKTIYEKKIEILENINEKILERLTKEGEQTLTESIKESVYSDMERAKALLPETIIEQIQPEKPEPTIVQPGQVLGNRKEVGR